MGNHGIKLRELRRAAGLTQCALARLAIVARGSISHVERGRYAPTPRFAGKVCHGLSHALGFSVIPPEVFPETFPLTIPKTAGRPAKPR